jgi:hypothetical protein
MKLDIDQESEFMTDSETSKLITDSKPTSYYLAKPVVEPYKKAYNLVKIMWKAVDILDSYRNSEWIKNVMDYEVPFDIAHDLVNEANLDLNPEDVFCNDIKCLRPPIISKAKDLSKCICFGKPLRSRYSQHPLFGKAALGTSLFSSSSFMASSPRHSYDDTWQAVDFNIIKPREFQSTHVKQPSSSNFIAPAARMPVMSLRTSKVPVPCSPSMSTLHHKCYSTNQALNFCNTRPVGVNNVLASARVCPYVLL